MIHMPKSHLLKFASFMFFNVYILSRVEWSIYHANSAVKVHDPQTYRNLYTARERISFTIDPRDIFLSRHIDSSFVRAAVAYLIHGRTSHSELPLETVFPGYLRLVTVSSFYPWTSLDANDRVCHRFCPCSTYLHFKLCAGFVEPSMFFSDYYLFSLGFEPALAPRL